MVFFGGDEHFSNFSYSTFFGAKKTMKRIRESSAHYDNMRDVTLMCQHHILLHTTTYFTHLITLHNALLNTNYYHFTTNNI